MIRRQDGYTYTRNVLEHFSRELNKFYGKDAENIKAKLLCGADLLKSFTAPGVWSPDDV